MNFQLVRQDLARRGELTNEYWRSLHIAQKQEMKHASCIRVMLAELGYDNLSELQAMPRRLNEGLGDGVPLRWPAEMEPWARIEFNFAMEKYFSEGGLEGWCRNMRLFATTMEPEVDPAVFLRSVDWFEETVGEEEPWHVELDLEAVSIYRRLYPHFDMKGLLARVNVVRSPFIHVIAARQAFLRTLSPIQRKQQDAKPYGEGDRSHLP